MKSHQELISQLSQIKQKNDGNLLLVLTTNYKLTIPDRAIPLNRLKKLVGKNISIFRLGDQYYIKEMEVHSD